MRLLLVVLIATALAGCASVRRGLGEYQKAADRGVTIGGPPADGGGDTASTYVGGRSGDRAEAGGGKRGELPGGLGGDKVHPAYTSPPQS